MTERIPEAEIISIDQFRTSKRPALPQRVPGKPTTEFTLPEGKPRLKLIYGIHILSDCVEILGDNDVPIYDALVHQTGPIV